MKISRNRLILGLTIVVTIVSALAIFWVVREQREKLQAFLAVKEGVLYRSCQPSPLEGKKLSRFGITQVISLRERYEDESTFDEEIAACSRIGVKYVNIPIGTLLPTDRKVEDFLRLVTANRGATLVHCEKGKSRTGTMVACYRIVVEGWDPARALDDMLQHGDKSSEEKISEKKTLLRRVFKDRQAWLERLRNPATKP